MTDTPLTGTNSTGTTSTGAATELTDEVACRVDDRRRHAEAHNLEWYLDVAPTEICGGERTRSRPDH